jgi:aspartyl-tRNA(Asn)/glutamyl-tRNA(Gln) amidotransferase subunit B
MSDIPFDLWEPVIGLEIHVQLNTKTKLFSLAPNRFGDEPNTNITEVCTGQPGSLPILNKEAVRKAVQFGLAIDATIAPFSKFDRKSYFYPDSPRNFQITQYDQPILKGGKVSADVEGTVKEFAINRAHLEDDSGMLKHFSTFAGVDYNRAGVPLLEIVSEPCMHAPKEALAYAMAIKAIMLYLDASDCNMEEGSLRIDVNISVRPKGDHHLRTKVEIKNMNSFANMEMALEAEIRRQIIAYTNDQNVVKGTYRFDLERKETVMMREKEEAEDYRYFPEPDLLPLILSENYIESIRAALPELPFQRLHRYLDELNLPPYSAALLINDKSLCDFFETARQHTPHAKALCNWITVEFVGRAKELGKTIDQLGVKPQHIAVLVNLIDKGTITGRIAKTIADEMVAHPGKDPEKIIRENPDFQPMHEVDAIEPIVDQVLKDNPQSILDIKAGKTKALAFLVGQVMKLSKGKASPAIVNDLLMKKIKD